MFIFLQMYLTGIRRRKKEIRYVSIAIFSSVLFMSSVTLFQNCMDRYLIESNYQNYGDWVMSATKDYENSKIRFEELNHPYFEGVGVCKVAGNMVKRDGLPSDVCIGTADEAFFRLGSLTLCDGRMPEASDEIAMELSALSKLGYSYELGQTIRAAVEKDGAVPEKNYRLVGILKSYADNWNHKDSYRPPHCIVTEEGLSKLCGPSYETYYYRLGRDYENISMEEFTGAFLKPEYARAYNSYTYENRVWGSGMMFGTMKWVLVLAGALAGGLLGFLVYNFHPAKVFMGDTGSLFLGGAVCGMAFALDAPLVLVPVGVIYIAETMSDIIQVGYFKLTHGKRIFRMAPLHHHLELGGWSEVRIVLTFTGITVAFCLLAFVGVMYRYAI